MNKLTTWAFARLLTAFLLTFSFSQAGLSQDFSIRTNLLWDAVSEPNIGLAAYDRYDCKHCGTKVGEERIPAVVPKLALNVAYNPVARDKRKSRSKGSYVISGTDTITVMTPPVVFTVHLQDVSCPETEGDRVAKEDSWVMPIGKYRPLDYLTRPGIDSIQYARFPVDSWELNTNDASNAKVLYQD